MRYAGKDASKAFYNVGHSVDAQDDMNQYYIGEAIGKPIFLED